MGVLPHRQSEEPPNMLSRARGCASTAYMTSSGQRSSRSGRAARRARRRLSAVETPQTPYDLMGGREPVMALGARFYEIMERDEPALAAVHRRGPDGRIDAEVKARFALFLVGWLGGPEDYMQRHGHPRLRMRHARVPIDTTLRDAWVR
jgi:hemoglobin